jgi:hypothetical protein
MVIRKRYELVLLGILTEDKKQLSAHQYAATFMEFLDEIICVNDGAGKDVDLEAAGSRLQAAVLMSIAGFGTKSNYRGLLSADAFKETKTYQNGDYFKLTDYAPAVFRDLRHSFGLTHRDYRDSIESGLSGGSVGEGKSGMFFWFSEDGSYVIKTLKGFEKDYLVTILRDYHAHMTQHRRRTLMCWFFGLCQLEFESREGKVHKLAVIIMPNSFSHGPAALKMHRMYDLKGSFHNRIVSDAEIAAGTSVLKDQNFDPKVRRISAFVTSTSALVNGTIHTHVSFSNT